MRARDDAARSAALLLARGFADGARAGDGNPRDRRPAAARPVRRGRSDQRQGDRAPRSGGARGDRRRAALCRGRTDRAGGEGRGDRGSRARPAPDVAALVAALRRRLAPRSRVLYLAGRDRKSALEAALSEAGHLTTPVEVYAAEARAAWSEDEARAVAAMRRGAALFAPLRRARRGAGRAGGPRRSFSRASPCLPFAATPANRCAPSGAPRLALRLASRGRTSSSTRSNARSPHRRAALELPARDGAPRRRAGFHPAAARL